MPNQFSAVLPTTRMASVAWLSITVKQDLKVLLMPKIVKCSSEDSFGEVLGRSNEEFRGKTVLKILIANNDSFKEMLP